MVRFALRQAISEIQGRQKSSNILYTLNTYHRNPQISVHFALRPSAVRMSHILKFLVDYHVKWQKRQKKKKNRPKSKNFEFHNSFNNFGRDPPRKYT